MMATKPTGGHGEIIITALLRNKTGKGFKEVSRTLDQLEKGGKRVITTQKKIGRQWSDINKRVMEGTRGFKFYYLGMMFGRR